MVFSNVGFLFHNILTCQYLMLGENRSAGRKSSFSATLRLNLVEKPEWPGKTTAYPQVTGNTHASLSCVGMAGTANDSADAHEGRRVYQGYIWPAHLNKDASLTLLKVLTQMNSVGGSRRSGCYIYPHPLSAKIVSALL